MRHGTDSTAGRPAGVEAPALVTSLSEIDGRAGALRLRGRSIEDLVDGGLEATALLLARGHSTPAERRTLQVELGRARICAATALC